MFNHAPSGYHCPICLGIAGIENEHTLLKQSDLVFKDELVSVFINSFWIKNNPGHVIVVPNKHFENIYEVPTEYGYRIFEVAKKMAIAMRIAYTCEGITTLQNNEPEGGQHAFHFHLHIFPRYKNDELHIHMGNKELALVERRKEFVTKIKSQLD